MTATVKTLSTEPIKLELTPKDEYIKKGIVHITYPKINNAIYEYKWDSDEVWTPTNDLNQSVEAKNGTLLVRIREDENILLTNQMTINNIDTIPPQISLAEEQVTTNSITIPYNIIEEHIDEVTCKYSDVKYKYTTSGTVGENACTLSKLTNNKNYYYEICASDLVGNHACQAGSTKTSNITNPGIEMTSTPTSPVNGYVRETTAHITFTSTNITTPTYYIKSTIGGTTNNNTLEVCGSEDKPNGCSSLSTKTLEVNKWYKVSGDINVTYNTESDNNGTIYALTYDETNYSGASTGTILKIDRTQPIVTFIANKSITGTKISTNTWSNETLKFTLTKGTTGGSGSTIKYCVDTNNSCTPNTTATSNTPISLNNTGTFYIRYQVLGGTGLNSNIGSFTGKVASISGTPTITASWPSTTQIKVTVSGMTTSGDTLEYKYSLGNTLKQDWTTSNTYTYTGLTQGTAYSIKVETRLQNSKFIGNSKTATINTSKSVSGTDSGWSSSASCSSSTYNIPASGVYGSTTLNSPSCSSYQEQTGTEPVYKTCTTSLSNQDSCPSSTNCTIDGHTASVNKSGQSSTIIYTCNYSGNVQTGTTPTYSSCSTSYQTTGSCASTRSCSKNGYTGTVSKSSQSSSTSYTCGSWSNAPITTFDTNGGNGYTSCTSQTNNIPSACNSTSSYSYYVCSKMGSSSSSKYQRVYYNFTRTVTPSTTYTCNYSGSIQTGTTPTYTNCTTSYTTTSSCDSTRSCTVNGHTGTVSSDGISASKFYTCNYSGSVQTGTQPVYTTKYKATYSGVVKPSMTNY